MKFQDVEDHVSPQFLFWLELNVGSLPFLFWHPKSWNRLLAVSPYFSCFQYVLDVKFSKRSFPIIYSIMLVEVTADTLLIFFFILVLPSIHSNNSSKLPAVVSLIRLSSLRLWVLNSPSLSTACEIKTALQWLLCK